MIVVWVILGICAVLVAALLAASVFFFRFSIRRYRVEGTDEQYEDEGSIWKPYRERMEEAQRFIKSHTTQKVDIVSFDGLRLTALYLPAKGQPKGVIVAFHGYRSLATIDFALEVEFFHQLGYHVLLPYQRSHGESQGKYITYGVKERFDCRDWAHYAARRFGKDLPLFLAGISMGAATVMMASELDLPENTRGIVADCGFTTPWEIMAYVAKRDFRLPEFPLLYLMDWVARLRAGFALKGADTREALAKTSLPVLFIHGQADDFVPASMTEENYQACRSEKELYLVPEAGHALSFAVDTQGCEKAIKAFLEKYGEQGPKG